ncbi:chemotaxis protein, partial [Arcobacter defluvii]
FFSYLNRSSKDISLLDDSSKDEFGEMAKFVNDNIKQIEKTINQDTALIEDAKVVMTRVNNGWYGQFIEKSTSNASLEEFRDNVNKMIESTRKRFEEVDEILEEYSKLDYRKALKMHPNDEKGGVFERLVVGINTLQDSITQMLIDNKTNGLTLDASSDILLINVDKLNLSSNEAAA